MKHLLFLPLLLCLACAPNTPETEQTITTKSNPAPQLSDQEQIARIVAETRRAIANKSAKDFNALLEAGYGLYVIETPGAVPQIRQVHNIATFREQNTGRTLFDLDSTVADCPVTFDKFPTFSCDTYVPGSATGFAKDGCFADSGAVITAGNLLNYIEIKPADAKKLANAAQIAHYAVLETYTHYKYYFGKINGRYKLLFLNISKPCAA